MTRIAALLALTALIGGCSSFGGATPGYREPGTTAVWGAWTLRTPDSTAFAGADDVQLLLSPGTFALSATYPNSAPIHVSGSATMSERGVLTLVPRSSVEREATGLRSLSFLAGEPISLLASASGGTLVFSPEHRDADPTPSSVWHRTEAARAAGFVKSAVALPDSSRRP